MTLRAGIVGCGMIAGGSVDGRAPISGNHADACRIARGLTLVTACDPDLERRHGFADLWSLHDVYPDVRTMMLQQRPELVIVASPADSHEASCLAAIEGGARGVLCEKPFTGHASSARIVRDAARAHGCALVVNFMRRWDTSHRALAARIREGALGSLRTVHATYTGTLRGNGTHFVDTLRMLAPGMWSPVWTSPLAPGRADGPVDAILERSDGLRAHLSAIRDAEFFVFESDLVGTRGRARLGFGGNEIRIAVPAPHADYPGYLYLRDHEHLPTMTLASAFVHALQALVDHVELATALEVDATEHVESLELIDALIAHATHPRGIIR